MLIGEFKHSIDAKKRISLPSSFRKQVGKKVVITRGLDGCLFLYPLESWESISEKLGEMGMGQAGTRGLNRFLLSGAVEVDVDKVGRILIPEYLAKFAGLKGKVVFAGVHSRVELWNEKTWQQYTARIEKDADALAEQLGDLGMF